MKSSRYAFFLMFTITLLLNANFTILRSLRTTLTVVDLGGGSHSIPFFELFGVMPCAILMTWLLTKLINHFSIDKVFLFVISFFILFFIVFKSCLYPSLIDANAVGGFGGGIRYIVTMLFYTVSELWKPALIMILFWGLINKHVLADEAKKIYGPLMLSGSLGAIIAGPITSLCTSDRILKLFPLSVNHWENSINLMIITISLFGFIAGLLYMKLYKLFYQLEPHQNRQIKQSSFKENILTCWKNEELRLLSWIVIVDYISYSVGEVIFFDILKNQFPEPAAYCNYMGYLSLWSGILTLISSLFITPFVLTNYRWVTAALITPICLLVTQGAFFIILSGYSVDKNWFGLTEGALISLAVFFGSIQFCLCRAAKYTFFDSSKELSFVFMDASQRMDGKLIIDGLCARLGKGGASALSLVLISAHGGVIASSFSTGVLTSVMVLSWLRSTWQLGKIIDKASDTSIYVKA